ncbi:Rqc2 family fibronectin-binding protein [Defluviitalea phaphyphila]|uniref:Rqc2 family fibronectin-binding protein n=1 Tax=Defluviitalea phaphyphila TaxID=1473580 RepID=UPI00073087B8|nr:NFACT RNA binding domain-containing protein [Defluviitalea phaphyphila]
MALDGIVISNIVYEIKKFMLYGRIDKIYQPETDEIVLSIRSEKNNYKLLLTSHNNYPRLHITNQKKKNPSTPPMFCMILRKHILGGRLINVIQPDFERIIEFHIETLNEMGDLCTKKLIVEIMGRHSNIILVDDNNKILDSIVHVSKDKSSVREVLPGKKYIKPPSQNKLNPLLIDNYGDYLKGLKGTKLQKSIYQSFSGISPIIASEICHRSNLDPSLPLEKLTYENKKTISKVMNNIFSIIKNNLFTPQIIFDPANNNPIEFSSIDITQFIGYKKQEFDSISYVIETYYSEKDRMSRIKQKSSDIHKIIQNNLERCYKKKDLQLKQLKDISNREELRIYGELITANIYSISKGMNSFHTINFYDENQPEITIPLDPLLTPAENAQKYFKQYNKAKRTYTALNKQLKQTEEEIIYLESLLSAIQSSTDENDINDIRQELKEQGYIKNKKRNKIKEIEKSKPLHFVSKEGFDIYVGKNNRQNDELTLRFANPTDLWLHTKDIPGSHVIIKTKNKEVPKNTLILAANLAALHSKAKNSSNVPVDYTFKKHVRKPNGAKPGMVIYDNQKTIYVTPDELKIQQLKI